MSFRHEPRERPPHLGQALQHERVVPQVGLRGHAAIEADEPLAAASRRAGTTGRALTAVGLRWRHPLTGGGAVYGQTALYPLDRTLIVVTSEFGRPPEFDSGGGRQLLLAPEPSGPTAV